MKTQVVGGLAMLLLATGAGAWAQEAIVGEKGQGGRAVVGEKGIVGEKGRGTQNQRGQAATAAVLPPDIARLLQRPTVTVRYRPAALKLQQLPAQVRAAQQPGDLGAPFRIEPAQRPAAGRQWYAHHVVAITDTMQEVQLARDPSTQTHGRFGVSFPVQPGYRYLVDCAVAHATEFAVSHTGLGQPADEARIAANSGFVSLVSGPVSDAGRGWVQFKAVRTQSAAWEWRGCEITPLRTH